MSAFLRSAIFGEQEVPRPTPARMHIPTDWRAPSIPAPNPSQLQAIAETCRAELALVQGPPGTGKTDVAVHIVHMWALQ
eukprot:2017554-Prymnesium_polylepis.1